MTKGLVALSSRLTYFGPFFRAFALPLAVLCILPKSVLAAEVKTKDLSLKPILRLSQSEAGLAYIRESGADPKTLDDVGETLANQLAEQTAQNVIINYRGLTPEDLENLIARAQVLAENVKPLPKAFAKLDMEQADEAHRQAMLLLFRSTKKKSKGFSAVAMLDAADRKPADEEPTLADKAKALMNKIFAEAKIFTHQTFNNKMELVQQIDTDDKKTTVMNVASAVATSTVYNPAVPEGEAVKQLQKMAPKTEPVKGIDTQSASPVSNTVVISDGAAPSVAQQAVSAAPAKDSTGKEVTTGPAAPVLTGMFSKILEKAGLSKQEPPVAKAAEDKPADKPEEKQSDPTVPKEDAKQDLNEVPLALDEPVSSPTNVTESAKVEDLDTAPAVHAVEKHFSPEPIRAPAIIEDSLPTRDIAPSSSTASGSEYADNSSIVDLSRRLAENSPRFSLTSWEQPSRGSSAARRTPVSEAVKDAVSPSHETSYWEKTKDFLSDAYDRFSSFLGSNSNNTPAKIDEVAVHSPATYLFDKKSILAAGERCGEFGCTKNELSMARKSARVREVATEESSPLEAMRVRLQERLRAPEAHARKTKPFSKLTVDNICDTLPSDFDSRAGAARDLSYDERLRATVCRLGSGMPQDLIVQAADHLQLAQVAVGQLPDTKQLVKDLAELSARETVTQQRALEQLNSRRSRDFGLASAKAAGAMVMPAALSAEVISIYRHSLAEKLGLYPSSELARFVEVSRVVNEAALTKDCPKLVEWLLYVSHRSLENLILLEISKRMVDIVQSPQFERVRAGWSENREKPLEDYLFDRVAREVLHDLPARQPIRNMKEYL